MRRIRRRTTLPPLLSLEDRAEAPPLAQQVTRKVMQGEWRDPDDTAPSAARTARTVRAYRSYDPLRRMRERYGTASCITTEHILAADRLRRLADAAVIGFVGLREMQPVNALCYGPRSGPSRAALKQANAWPPLLRALRLFNAEQRALLGAVVLENRNLAGWCARQAARGVAADPHIEKGRLLAILDVLVVHFDTDIREEIARGDVLTAQTA